MTRKARATYEVAAKDKTGPGLSSVERRLQRAEQAGRRLGGALAAVAGPAALGLLTARSLKAIDAQAKLADRLNASTEGLARLQLQTRLAGQSNEVLSSSLERMQKRLGEAAAGGGAAIRFLEQMNLDVNELNRMKADEQFERIAESIRGLSNRNEQAAATAAIFGREGVRMLNLIDGLGEGSERAAELVDKLGVAVSRVEANKIEQANDAMEEAKLVAQGLGNQIAIQVSPIIAGLSKKFVNAAVEAGGFENKVRFGMDIVANAVGVVADGVRGLTLIWKRLKVVTATQIAAAVSGFAMLDRGLSALLDKIPGISVEAAQGLQDLAASLQGMASGFRSEFVKALEEPLPSEIIKSSLAGFQAEADRIAKDAASKVQRSALPDPDGASIAGALGSGGGANREQKEQERLRKRLMGRVESIRRSLLDEEEAERDSFARKQAVLDEALGNELISRQTHNELLDKLRADRDANLNQRALDRFESVREGLLSEQESEIEAFANRQKILDDALNKRLISRQKHEALSEKLKGAHEKRVSDIEKRGLNDRQKFERLSLSQKTAFTLQSLGSLLQGVGQHNKTLFKITKAAGIAEAIVNTYTGVTKTLASYPWPFAAVPAAAHLAAGLAQVASIRSQSFGGGGAAGGSAALGGGGASAVSLPSVSTQPVPDLNSAVQEAQERSIRLDITINGAVDQNFVRRELVPQIQEALEDGSIAA